MSETGYIYLIKAYIHNSGNQVYKVGKMSDEPVSKIPKYINKYKIRDEDVITSINLLKNLDVFEKLIIDKIGKDSNLLIHKRKQFFLIKNNNKDYIYDIEDMILKERKEFRKNNYIVTDKQKTQNILKQEKSSSSKKSNNKEKKSETPKTLDDKTKLVYISNILEYLKYYSEHFDYSNTYEENCSEIFDTKNEEEIKKTLLKFKPKDIIETKEKLCSLKKATQTYCLSYFDDNTILSAISDRDGFQEGIIETVAMNFFSDINSCVWDLNR